VNIDKGSSEGRGMEEVDRRVRVRRVCWTGLDRLIVRGGGRRWRKSQRGMMAGIQADANMVGNPISLVARCGRCRGEGYRLGFGEKSRGRR